MYLSYEALMYKALWLFLQAIVIDCVILLFIKMAKMAEVFQMCL